LLIDSVGNTLKQTKVTKKAAKSDINMDAKGSNQVKSST
jgi:hypothetical protein